jgi:hypothetical protein
MKKRGQVVLDVRENHLLLIQPHDIEGKQKAVCSRQEAVGKHMNDTYFIKIFIFPPNFVKKRSHQIIHFYPFQPKALLGKRYSMICLYYEYNPWEVKPNSNFLSSNAIFPLPISA